MPGGKRLFKARLDLLSLLASKDTRVLGNLTESTGKYDAFVELRGDPTNELHDEVAAMNLDNFIVRTELEHVTRFAEREVWNTLDDAALGDLRTHVAGLPGERDAEHISAKLFDRGCLNLQLALLRSTNDERLTRQGVMAAEQLYEPPFTALHHEGLDGTFNDMDADAIVAALTEINRRAVA
jgi:type I restriction enzyme R subunit